MLKVLIEERERVELYMKLNDDMKEDLLSENEWRDLEDLVGLLEPFEEISTWPKDVAAPTDLWLLLCPDLICFYRC